MSNNNNEQYFIFDDIDINIYNEILENKKMKQKIKQKILNKQKRRMMRKQEIKLKEIRFQNNIVIIENYF